MTYQINDTTTMVLADTGDTFAIDPMLIFMDTFRADVAAELSKAQDKKEDENMKQDTVRYNTIASLPAFAQATLIKMVDKGIIGGGGKAKDADGRPADLDLSIDMVRVFVTNDRAGLYD